MTETTRTTVTLSEFNMSLVEDLIGILGNTRAQVISAIVERYLQNEQTIALIEKLKSIKMDKEEEIRKEKARKPEIIEKKIENLRISTDTLSIKSFLNYLKIDLEFFYNNLPVWKQKYKFELDQELIQFL